MKHRFDIYKDIDLCDKCYDAYLQSSNNELKLFLAQFSFSESEGYRGTTVFLKNNIKIYYQIMFQSWKIKNLLSPIDLDLYDIEFPLSQNMRNKLFNTIVMLNI